MHTIFKVIKLCELAKEGSLVQKEKGQILNLEICHQLKIGNIRTKQSGLRRNTSEVGGNQSR